ncbi:hypothetical protein E3P89_04012 [Wallemia ichthyophaga]|uniref:Uncharacterized protein n=1 Tax=Wallemia ichthyophaga TaxID=245174 RepID=A0A4T0EUU3_WALIC|nr:hypothetical protein E3P91_04079 [Wallemia ichthyophaga]TIA78720.1 hypothetical protein E3P98_03690 [Wallemia ichthyophaga]TIA95461.1 hypothetical protein E3P94_04051 [Wallemia ichthyophaga]TIB07109.1 hypothetical protein E3P93_04021 [Wallemia ichthyophaga]TIB07620.1 hypothetical protein E3P90_04018 [Wallemia ichthyophaga]
MPFADRIVDFLILCLAVAVSHLEIGRCLLNRQLGAKADKESDSDSGNEKDSDSHVQIHDKPPLSVFCHHVQLIVGGVKTSLQTVTVRILVALTISIMLIIQWTVNKIKNGGSSSPSSNSTSATFTNPFKNSEEVEEPGKSNTASKSENTNNDESLPTQNKPSRRHSTLHTSKGEEIETPENKALTDGESEPDPDVVETGPAKKGGGPRRGSLAGEQPEHKNPWSQGAF